ncbi:amine oxidase [Panaeolus papilionaceus]|nr:amine oxidase [Panaeolus papilionaceus]
MKVAVVGSGVSGLAATWLLNEHSDHTVHLYESDYRPGGHANTVHYIPKGKGWRAGVDVDTGFIVFNPSTYPNFLRFLHLFPPKDKPSGLFSHFRKRSSSLSDIDQGITINETEMTFSISRDLGAFEWAGKNLATVFCQPYRLLDPSMWRMIYDVLRFNACSRRVLLDDQYEEVSIGEYLTKNGYSDAFRMNYLVPMTAAIWSTPPDKCFLDFPARTLIQFMYNHHLLQITGKPSWLTIKGGSHKYVNQILSKLPKEQYHISTPITCVRTVAQEGGGKSKVVLTTSDGEEILFDHVILACHSDTALKLLRAGGITSEEERILNQFSWNKNEAILHADVKLMPLSRMAWSCWNYLAFTKPVSDSKASDDDKSSEFEETLYPEDDMEDKGKVVLKSMTPAQTVEVNQVSLTNHVEDGMNDLQHIPEKRYGPVLVTLNAPFEPDPETVFGRWKYDHPVLDSKAIKAQSEMHKIQNTRSISYAGAYLKYGFHEDGFTSGLLAACSLDEDSGLPRLPPRSSASIVIPTRDRTVRPPFAIQHADRHLAVRRDSSYYFYCYMAKLFDRIEAWGLTVVLGVTGSFLLALIGCVLGVNDSA